MTKKDYIKIADCLVDIEKYLTFLAPDFVAEKQPQLYIEDVFSDMLRHDNDRFDAGRFAGYIQNKLITK